ncbi:MAG: YfhO family protein [candidate division WOR-3 bacterium]
MKTLRRFLPGIILGIFIIIFFWEIIWGKSYFWEDVIEHYYPYHYFLFQNLRHFAIPLWNPYIFSGMPFLGDVQSQIFYPLNWLLAFISSPSPGFTFWVLEIKMIIHFFLAGIFFYLFLRELNLSFYASLFGAVIFTFSGFLVTHLIHLTMINTYIWIPLLFFFLFRWQKRSSLSDALFAGIILGVANLASHPQITLYFVYTIIIFFLFWLIFKGGERRFLRLKKSVIALFLIFFVGFGLAAIQYLPSYEHSKYTLREEMTFQESAEVSLPPSFPLLLLIPKFFGSITGRGTDSVPFWGKEEGYHYWETACYLGIISLIFAILGIFFYPKNEKRLFLILAILSLLAGLGRYTPFYKLVFYFLPGFNRFRIPARFIGLFTFSMATLAGFGMEFFIKERWERMANFWRGLLIFSFFMLLFWFLFLFGAFRGLSRFLSVPIVQKNINNQFGMFFIFLIIGIIIFGLRKFGKSLKGKNFLLIKPEGLAALAIFFTFLDLYFFGKNFNLSSYSPEDYYPRNQNVRYLQNEREREIFRVNARKGRYMILRRNEGMIHGLELLEGYTPLGLAAYATFDIPLERKYDLLNAKYKIKVDELKRKMDLVLNPTCLPRFRFFYQYLLEPNRKRILEILSDDNFDHQHFLILERKPSLFNSGTEIKFPDSVKNWIKVLRMENDRMELKVYTEEPGFLFLSEVYYPNWRVKVDGQEGEIYRADYCLRAVPLDKGEHHVFFYYDTKTLKFGAGLSFLTLIFTIALLFWKKRRKE